MNMGFSILRTTCWRAAARISSCGGGSRRMMNTTTTTTTINPSRVSPWLMLPPASEDSGCGGGAAYKLYSPATNKVQSFKKEEPPSPSAEGLVRQVGSSHGWVASFNLDNQHIFLSNPTTSRHLKLPDIRTLPEDLFRPGCRTVVEKIILSASPAADDSLAFMTFGVRGMSFCRPSRGGAWSQAGGAFYDDFVFSSRRNRLFCLTSDNAIECWDLTGPDNSPTIVRKDSMFDDDDDEEDEDEEKEEEEDGSRMYRSLVLAEESDRLFLVVRRVWEGVGPDGSYAEDTYLGPDRDNGDGNPYLTFSFDVHEIDWERGKMNYMDGTLDGLAMFVGNNHGVAVQAAEFPGLKADSVYFTDEQEFTPLDDNWSNYGGHDVGIFDYRDRDFYSVYYPSLPSSIARLLPPPIWLTPSPY